MTGSPATARMRRPFQVAPPIGRRATCNSRNVLLRRKRHLPLLQTARMPAFAGPRMCHGRNWYVSGSASAFPGGDPGRWAALQSATTGSRCYLFRLSSRLLSPHSLPDQKRSLIPTDAADEQRLRSRSGREGRRPSGDARLTSPESRPSRPPGRPPSGRKARRTSPRPACRRSGPWPPPGCGCRRRRGSRCVRPPGR